MTRLFAAAVLAVAGWSMAAGAATQTGNLTVRLSIVRDCQVNAGIDGQGAGDAVLDFGEYGVLNANVDAISGSFGEGAIQVQCTRGTPYSIGLGSGENATDVNSRRMRGQATADEYVSYQLYKAAARGSGDVWGDTGAGLLSRTATGDAESWTVYGRVPPQTTPSAQLYQDNVLITVSY